MENQNLTKVLLCDTIFLSMESVIFIGLSSPRVSVWKVNAFY